MSKIFKFSLSVQKVHIKEIFETFKGSPRESRKMATNKVVFEEFNDWLQTALQVSDFNPYAMFWRALALRYPQKLIIKDFNLFFEELATKPQLAAQIVALLFTVPAKKIPDLNVLKIENQEQKRVLDFLNIKKSLGNDKDFVKWFFAVKVRTEKDTIIFNARGKKIERPLGSKLSANYPLKNRVNTALGKGTLVLASMNAKNFYEICILFDGGSEVTRMSLAYYKKITCFMS